MCLLSSWTVIGLLFSSWTVNGPLFSSWTVNSIPSLWPSFTGWFECSIRNLNPDRYKQYLPRKISEYEQENVDINQDYCMLICGNATHTHSLPHIERLQQEIGYGKWRTGSKWYTFKYGGWRRGWDIAREMEGYTLTLDNKFISQSSTTNFRKIERVLWISTNLANGTFHRSCFSSHSDNWLQILMFIPILIVV